MALHIGNIIREKVRSSPYPVKTIAERINKSENTLYDIYKRESVDTGLLLKLCEILDFNFFALYNQEHPVKLMRDQEIDRLKKTIDDLEEKIALQDEHIRNLKEIILTQKEAKEKKR